MIKTKEPTFICTGLLWFSKKTHLPEENHHCFQVRKKGWPTEKNGTLSCVLLWRGQREGRSQPPGPRPGLGPHRPLCRPRSQGSLPGLSPHPTSEVTPPVSQAGTWRNSTCSCVCKHLENPEAGQMAGLLNVRCFLSKRQNLTEQVTHSHQGSRGRGDWSTD